MKNKLYVRSWHTIFQDWCGVSIQLPKELPVITFCRLIARPTEISMERLCRLQYSIKIIKRSAFFEMVCANSVEFWLIFGPLLRRLGLNKIN